MAPSAYHKKLVGKVLLRYLVLMIGFSFVAAGAAACITRYTDVKCVTPTAVLGFLGIDINIGPGVLWCFNKQDNYTTCSSYPCGACVAGGV